MAAMSSGEGAEEAAKDAGDIEAFFKTGETEKLVHWVGSRPTANWSFWSSCMRGTLFGSTVDHFLGEGGLEVKERRCLSLLIFRILLSV